MRVPDDRPNGEGFRDYQDDYIQRKLARGGHFSRGMVTVREGKLMN